jgi:hypothetical protein
MEKRHNYFICMAVVFLLSVSSSINVWANYKESSLIQHFSSGHTLGFTEGGVYLTGLNHTLEVAFIDSKNVAPVSVTEAHPATEGLSILRKVSYPELWPGVTLVYESKAGAVAESTYTLAPGIEASSIGLRYNVPVELNKDGSLRLYFKSGYMLESPPVAWQEIEGKRVPVEVFFTLSEGHVGFTTGEYNKDYSLVIDPTYTWHTFYGSSSYGDGGTNIAVDGDGNIYIAGRSNGTWGTPLHAFTGEADKTDIMILKLNSNGEYQWHTFYGSTANDEACDIALDEDGNLLVSGFSNGTWGTPLNAYNNGSDITVMKLNSSGELLWNTFYGSDNAEVGRNIALDSAGNIYVAAYGSKTWGTPLNPYTGSSDIIVLKLNSAGVYQWHTFYGSSAIDYAWDITLDSTSNVYVTGQSYGSWGDSQVHTYGASEVSTSNVYVLKLNSSGTYLWNTFYPALWGWTICTGESGSIYVAGRSTLSWGSPLNSYSGGSDIYAFKLSSSGALQWNTFYGGNNTNDAFGMVLDDSENLYITGTSDGSWGTPLNAYSGGMDICILSLDSSGTYKWNTFYGSAESGKNDTGWGIALDSSGKLDVTGQSWSSWGTPLNAHTGTSDIFALQLYVGENDGMDDDWEIYYFGTTSRNGKGDYDDDGLTDLNEYRIGSNPTLTDTDSDGISDGNEDANHNGTVDSGETNPTKSDTDSDGMTDGWEVQYGLDPLVNDANDDKDNDGYTNLKEYQRRTDPSDSNSYPSSKGMPWLPLLLGE